MLFLIRNLLPTGLTGVAITGLLAAFMAGMAANISAFNTVFSVDIWQHYVIKDKADVYYVKVGRIATVVATVVAIGTAFLASGFSRPSSGSSTLRCSRRSSSACFGRSRRLTPVGRDSSSVLSAL